MEDLRVIKTKGYVYQSFIESKENTTPYMGIDEAIDNALDNMAEGIGQVWIYNNAANKTITIMDNGKGIDYELMEEILANAICHRANSETIGIKGVGIKKIGALVSSMKDSEMTIITSTGNEYATKAIFNLTDDDEAISHPKLIKIPNRFKESFNVDKYGRLRGTVIIIKNTERINFTDRILLDYSIRYAPALLNQKKRIFINGKELLPIDPTYSLVRPSGAYVIDKNRRGFNAKIVIDDTEKKYYIDFDLTIYHKKTPYTKHLLKLRSSQMLDTDMLRFKHPFEEVFNFNSLAGIYTIRGGRFINQGGNVSNMFSLVNDKINTTRGKGMFGDISGGLSQYNRILIDLNDDKIASIFEVPSIKSKGIQKFPSNDLLFDYYTNVDGKSITLFEAISYIRKFNDAFYVNNTKSRNEWKYQFVDLLSCYFDKYDFSLGKIVEDKKIKRVKQNIKSIKSNFRVGVSSSSFQNTDSSIVNVTYTIDDLSNVASITEFTLNEKSNAFRRLSEKKVSKTVIKNKLEYTIKPNLLALLKMDSIKFNEKCLIEYLENISKVIIDMYDEA